MTFTFDPPLFLLVLAILIPLLAVAVLVLGRRHPARKVVGMVVAAVIAVVLVTRFFTIRASSLTVDDAGITGDVYGSPKIAWSDVEEAVYLPDLHDSKYALRRPGNAFASLGTLGAGYGPYTLADGDSAVVAVERRDSAAVLIATRDTIYVFGPSDPQGLASAIADHVALTGWDGA